MSQLDGEHFSNDGNDCLEIQKLESITDSNVRILPQLYDLFFIPGPVRIYFGSKDAIPIALLNAMLHQRVMPVV